MSVVPFILSGNARTVVETKQEFQTLGGIDGDVILIQNFEKGQILNTQSSNVTYDLRVGNEYRGHRDANKTELLDGEKIRLDPGTAIIIETMEVVHFPKNRFGHIVPKVSLLQSGISNTSSKIDPGYSGNLLVTVFNLGKKTVTLEKGAPFCTFYVLDIASGVTAYEKPGKKLPGAPSPKNVFTRFVDYVERRSTLVNAILTIMTTILTAITLFNTINQNQQKQVPPSTNEYKQPLPSKQSVQINSLH